MPNYIRLRRKKGWRKPPEAINVTRQGKQGGKWGNPFNWKEFPDDMMTESTAKNYAMLEYKKWFFEDGQRELRIEATMELRGKDLCCYCHENEPHCHAKFLLKYVNRDLTNDREYSKG